MQKEFTSDQHQFRESLTRFMQAKSTPDDVREQMTTEQGYDTKVWQQLCSELGVAGIHIPEQYGGFGFGHIELGIVMEEMGKNLFCGPYLSTSVMSASALIHCASEDAKEALLPDIAMGQSIVTLVMDNLDAPERVGSKIQENSNLITGTANIVVDAAAADSMLVVATSSSGLGLFLVKANDSNVVVTSRESLDPTRKLCEVTFSSASAQKVGDVDLGTLQRVWRDCSVALAHEMIGGAQYLLSSTIEYTKLRVQFGRPIGSFQALKHRCADLLMEVEFARASTYHAARLLDATTTIDGVAETEVYAPHMAKALAADTYSNVARAAVQLRGGIGFTWEDDTHLWFKRAKSSEVFLGTPERHREWMMQLMEGETS
jgi:alkylation response protein AidB-like acyl-CoA dehydrogenase